MKNKKIICTLMLALSLFCTPVNTCAQDNSEPISTESNTPTVYGDDTATTYAYDIRWMYKTVNGHLYRRQYNFSTGQWIGEWERVN